MFGALAKDMLPEPLDVARDDLVVVSIMPCTAKKYEAKLPKFAANGRPDVDHVLTTQELGRMIEEKGLQFHKLQPESLDMPMGFKTGAGIIFGATGGVTEAVLRYAAEKLGGAALAGVEFTQARGDKGLREATVTVAGTTLRLAIVHGLRNAKRVAEQVRAGKCEYDLIEVMACPGGCVGGAGQPVTRDGDARRQRTRGLFEADKMLQLHKSQDNHMVTRCYTERLGEIGGHAAHTMLHTQYQSRRRIEDESFPLAGPSSEPKVTVSVCVGTGCYLKGSQSLLHDLIRRVEQDGLAGVVQARATFCFEHCDRGPTVSIGETVLTGCTLDKAMTELNRQLNAVGA
jgi:NADH-quinone oxidoreductase subunit G